MLKSSRKLVSGKIELRIKERGISRPGMLFLLAIFGLAVYAAFRVVPIYYNYHEFVGHMHAQARLASDKSEEEIKEFLTRQVDKLNIPIENDYDLEVSKNGKTVYMYLDYTEELWVNLGEKEYLLWEFPFVAEVDEEY